MYPRRKKSLDLKRIRKRKTKQKQKASYYKPVIRNITDKSCSTLISVQIKVSVVLFSMCLLYLEGVVQLDSYIHALDSGILLCQG